LFFIPELKKSKENPKATNPPIEKS
jgi:hypothetical protein